MYVVTVHFEVVPAQVDSFAAAMRAQARNSLAREPDCLRFDVCRDPERPEQTFLYEVYTDEVAFQAHLESEHFKAFDRQVSAWVVSKTVRTYLLEEDGTGEQSSDLGQS